MTSPVTTKPTLTQRLLRLMQRIGTLIVTAGVIGLAGALATGGASQIGARANAVPQPEPAPALSVTTNRVSIVDSYEVTRRFAGQIEAGRVATLSFETGGTVVEVLVDEGAEVAAGQILARQDIRLLSAEDARLVASAEALEAQIELAELTTQRQRDLNQRGFAATERLDQARLGLAELRARRAEIDAARVAVAVRIDKSVLRAPFAGRVAERSVDDGVTVGGGQTVLSILESRAPQFRAGIDPALADRLAVGQIDMLSLSGAEVPATLIALRPDLDPQSRTRTAIWALPAGMVYGETGVISLRQRVPATGAILPATALREGVRGSWTILTANPDGAGGHVAGREAVELIHAEDAQVFVRGTFRDGQVVVLAGAHRVVPGQAVNIADAGRDTDASDDLAEAR